MPSFPARPRALFALLLLAAAPACTASDDDAGTGDESDLRIKPKDGETLARLTVATPSGWTLPVNASEDATVSYRGVQQPLNAPQRLPEGDGSLLFRGKFDVQVTAGNVKLEKGKLKTVELGAMKPTFVPATESSSTLRRDFGPTPSLTVHYTAPGLAEAQVFGQSRANPAFWNGAPQRPLLAPPGDYRFSWGMPILTDVKKTLGSGENATVDLAPSDKRATIVVKKPAARELPDVPAVRCHLPARTFLVHRRAENTNGVWGEPPSYDQNQTSPQDLPLQPGSNHYGSSEQITSWAALPLKNDTTVKVFPFAASEGANHYELVVNNVATPLALKPGDTKTVQLERLDVDDVEVTKETGETYMVKGTWQLFRQGANNAWLPITVRQDCSTGAGAQTSFPTNSGLDVLPGTYRLVISYATAEGTKTQDHTVSVP